ncbi:MAG TPA: TolC family protein [Candidatus Sumerlaeota bacterium]|nr:TolC family protein [Candidatus Sumerlaeota bacterium]
MPPRSPAPLLILALFAAGCVRLPAPVGAPPQWRAAQQPPLPPDQAEALATAPTLHQALRLALERNPALAAARRRWFAAIQTIPQAASLPDPMLEAGVDLTEPMPMLERGWSFGIRQELPWWRKLWARGELAAREADVMRLEYEIAARDLLIDVKDAWYELYYLDQAAPITARVEEILRNQALLAYGELRTGRTQLAEAFRAESQAAQLAYDRLLLADERVARAERLRALLNLPPGAVIGPITAAPIYPVTDDRQELYARAEQWAQRLRISGLRAEQAEYEAYLARLSRLPDLTLGWMNEANVPAMMGDTMRTALGGMNLPIWQQRNDALIREREALAEAARLDAAAELNRLGEAVANAWLRVRTTDRLARLYREELLPRAQAAMAQAEALFRADQAAFASLLETTMAWHNFQLAYHRARADHGQAIGMLERALGTTAEARPAGATPDGEGRP